MGKIMGNKAGCTEWALAALGTFGCMVFGAALPGFCLLWGNMMDNMGGSGFGAMGDMVVYMVYLGVGVLLCAWV